MNLNNVNDKKGCDLFIDLVISLMNDLPIVLKSRTSQASSSRLNIVTIPFAALSEVVARTIFSCLSPALSSNIKFIVARPDLSVRSLARSIPRHATKSRVRIGYTISNQEVCACDGSSN